MKIVVVMRAGCIDVWEPKVLRSGAGAHFHSPSLVTEVAWEHVKNYMTEDTCLLYTSPSPRDRQKSRMPSSA